MSRIKSKDTVPECALRKSLHKIGYRYRKNVASLPGKPDIVLPKYKTVIFINGCFWHQHPGCPKASIPKSNTDYWTNKFKKNVQRDKKNYKKLRSLDWKVLIIWECELKNDFKAVVQNINNSLLL